MNPYLEMNDQNGQIHIDLNKYGFDACSCVVTALDIIAQIPGATIGKLSNGDWACSWNLPNNYRDFRQDECPHKAAALAFIAWKKGLES